MKLIKDLRDIYIEWKYYTCLPLLSPISIDWLNDYYIISLLLTETAILSELAANICTSDYYIKRKIKSWMNSHY